MDNEIFVAKGVPAPKTGRRGQALMFTVKRLLSTWPYLICLSILGGTLLSISSWIPVSPSEAPKTIKISLLNWIEGKRFASRAEQIGSGAAKGDLFHTWKMAIHQNPGNTDYQRRYLETLLSHDRRKENWEDALETSSRLLFLTRTNASELSLACRVLEHYHLNDQLLQTLRNYEGPTTPEIEKSLLLALFNENQIKAFEEQLDRSSEETQNNPIFKLYRNAISGARSPELESPDIHEQLAEAATDENTAETSLRLQLYVNHRQGNLTRFEESFDRLSHRFQDRTQDHLLYWDLLKRSGQLAEAQAAAKAFAYKPKSAKEVISVAEAYKALDLNHLGMRYLEHYLDRFGAEEESRFAQSQILTEQKDWNQLLRLAVAIRSDKETSIDLFAYSFYLEGKALTELSRLDDAKNAFTAIPKHNNPGSDYALSMGSNLTELGYPEIAHAVLFPERLRFRNNIRYWELILSVNRSLENTTQMLTASENLNRLEPQSESYSLTYSTLLLTQGHRSEEALITTTQVLEKLPKNPIAQLNYGYALITNGRPNDAVSVLSNIDESTLSAGNRSRYHLAWMDLHFRNQRLEEAWNAAQAIQPEDLLPEFRTRFRNMQEALRTEDPARFQPNLSLSE